MVSWSLVLFVSFLLSASVVVGGILFSAAIKHISCSFSALGLKERGLDILFCIAPLYNFFFFYVFRFSFLSYFLLFCFFVLFFFFYLYMSTYCLSIPTLTLWVCFFLFCYCASLPTFIVIS